MFNGTGLQPAIQELMASLAPVHSENYARIRRAAEPAQFVERLRPARNLLFRYHSPQDRRFRAAVAGAAQAPTVIGRPVDDGSYRTMFADEVTAHLTIETLGGQQAGGEIADEVAEALSRSASPRYCLHPPASAAGSQPDL